MTNKEMEEIKAFITQAALKQGAEVRSMIRNMLVDIFKEAQHDNKIDDPLEYEMGKYVSMAVGVHMRRAIRNELDDLIPRTFDLLKTVNALEDKRIREILKGSLEAAANAVQEEMFERNHAVKMMKGVK